MAQAQTVPAPGPGASAQAAAPAPQLTEVTVTGSRIITNGNNAPTPVTVVSPTQLMTTRPTNIFDNLSSLPMFSGSQGASTPPDNAPNNNGAVSALNLRNLGPLRALVLFDGHRVPPTSADGLVDINMMPEMLLQRVDVVTGGASAVYGSDAVTGVINFIPDTKFQGIKVDLQRGISTYHDDGSYRMGIAAGTRLFGDRGHVEVSWERYNSDGILWREQRPATDALWTLQGDGSAGDPWHLNYNTHINNISFGGVIVCPFGPSYGPLCPGAPLVGQTFATNGVLSPLNRGSNQGVSYGFLSTGGDGGYHNAVSLQDAARQDHFFARFDYDLSDDLQAYIMGSGAADHSAGYAGTLRAFPPGWNIGSCNAFLAAQYQQALGCTSQNDPNQPTFTFDRMYNPDLGEPGQRNEVWVHNYFAMAGLKGRFASAYHWDANYTHSSTTTNTRGDENQNLAHLYAALDAVVDPATGQTVCNATLTNPGLYPGCVPINAFGPTAPSQQALAYVFGRIETLTTNTMDDLSGSVTGPAFNDWAGPVRVALSGEVRRLSFEMTSNSLPSNLVDCTPLRFGNCTPGATTGFINTNAARSPVHQTVSEGAVEVEVPLLEDHPWVRDLSFNGAARFTHYANSSGGDPTLASTSFNATTWKAGLVWKVNDLLTLRWVKSRDIRAPNLYDLYNPEQVIPNQQVADYLVLVGGQPANPNPAQHFGGNPSLRPEIASTTTVGAIVRPLDSLSFSVDAYWISIRDAIAVIDGSTQGIQQACIASNGASPLCALDIRPAGCCTNTTIANELTGYVVEPYNIAQQKTWGVDFEENYAARLLGRPFGLRTLVTWQPHLDYNQAYIGFNDQAGAAYNPTYGLNPAPIWKASMFVHYLVTERIGLDLAERYRSRLRWNADPSQYSIGGVGSVAYTDATVTYSIPHGDDEFNVYFNVQNLFNKQPPPAPNPADAIFPGIGPVYAAGDDVVGRYYTLGLRARF
jgi:outer membrane receptor protein involved in Fe transport